MTWYTPGQVRKAIGVAATGAAGWGAMVVASASGPITSAEWIGLSTVGLAVLACFGLTNDDPTPTPTPPAQPLGMGGNPVS